MTTKTNKWVNLISNAIAVGTLAGIALQGDSPWTVLISWLIAGFTYFNGRRLARVEVIEIVEAHDWRLHNLRLKHEMEREINQ